MPQISRAIASILLSLLTLTTLMALLWPAAAGAQALGEATGAAKSDYVIGAGDVLRITVYQNTDLTLDARVNESGAISYPLLGAVALGGLSVTQAETRIADGLRKGNFVKQPQVSVLLMQVRGNQVSVLGMVNKPGRYPIEVTGMRLSEVLATAGGIAVGGSDIVQFTGVRSGKVVRSRIDIGKLMTGEGQEQDPVVLNGDALYVERMPMFYIYGEVQRPGALRLERDITVLQALAAGGGTTSRGTIKGLRVHRRGPDGKVREFEPAMTDVLIENDVVYVRESLF